MLKDWKITLTNFLYEYRILRKKRRPENVKRKIYRVFNCKMRMEKLLPNGWLEFIFFGII